MPDGKESTQTNASSITGNVYITLGSGQSAVQRGLQVFLIKVTEKVSTDITKITQIENAILNYNTTVIGKVRGQAYNNYYDMLGNLSAGVALIERHANEVYNYFNSIALESTRTDVNGAYKFNNLTNGDYYIFAQYKSSIENGYWLVKFSVEKGKPVTLDLSNFNFINITQKLQHNVLNECKEHAFAMIETQSGRMRMLGARKDTLEVETSSSQDAGPILGGFEYPSADELKEGTIKEASEEATKNQIYSLYGEIQKVDLSSNSVRVQYYDYDSNKDRVIDIIIGSKTEKTDFAKIDDLSENDWIDVTYSHGVKSGKAIAKTVVVEKETKP